MSDRGALSVALVTAAHASPERWVVFLHGILGTGGNWRTFARQLCASHPAYGAVLVDLRLHGQSQGFHPPHTIEACAADVRRTIEAELKGPVHMLVGHSFGGKVALEMLRAPSEVRAAWVIDSTPSARPDARGSESTTRIVTLLERLPERFSTREAFIEIVTREGHDRAIAMWLAMNVKPAPEGGFAWRIDLKGVRALLDDYFARDEWEVLETNAGRDVHLVVGGRSSVLDARDRARASDIAADPRRRVHVHTIAQAGHWVHVDAPGELLALVSKGTPP